MSRINLGKGRAASPVNQGKLGVRVHRSVKTRMEARADQVEGSQGRKYVPRATFTGEPIWVD